MSITGKQEMLNSLVEKHTDFIAYVESLSEKDFALRKDGKWSAGQQVEHLIKCLKPLVKVFGMPPKGIEAFFGKDVNHTRTENELLDIYRKKLDEGNIKAPTRFEPEEFLSKSLSQQTETLNSLLEALSERVLRFSDEDLNSLLVAHPLLGKMTLKEMLHNAQYHAEHHHKLTRNNLA